MSYQIHGVDSDDLIRKNSFEPRIGLSRNADNYSGGAPSPMFIVKNDSISLRFNKEPQAN